MSKDIIFVFDLEQDHDVSEQEWVNIICDMPGDFQGFFIHDLSKARGAGFVVSERLYNNLLKAGFYPVTMPGKNPENGEFVCLTTHSWKDILDRVYEEEDK